MARLAWSIPGTGIFPARSSETGTKMGIGMGRISHCADRTGVAAQVGIRAQRAVWARGFLASCRRRNNTEAGDLRGHPDHGGSQAKVSGARRYDGGISPSRLWGFREHLRHAPGDQLIFALKRPCFFLPRLRAR